MGDLTARESQRLTVLLDKAIGSTLRKEVLAQLPSAAQKRAEFLVANWIENHFPSQDDVLASLEKLGVDILREADAAIGRLLRDPAWVKKAVEEHITMAVHSALGEYCEESGQLPVEPDP